MAVQHASLRPDGKLIGLLKTIYRATFGKLRRSRYYRKAKLIILSTYEAFIPPRHDGYLIPPPKMRQLTTLNILGAQDHITDGKTVALEIDECIRQENSNSNTFNAILEFGCGCGRVLRHLSKMWPAVKLYGTDIDKSLIAWSSENLGNIAEFSINGYEPPLKYEDQSLDVIYMISVFTHIDEKAQKKWMEEFYRILKPAGLLLTTIVQVSKERIANEQWDYVNDAGFVYRYRKIEITPRAWVKEKSIHPHYIDTKHTLEYCKTAWSDGFDYCNAKPNANRTGQTILTLRKKS